MFRPVAYLLSTALLFAAAPAAADWGGYAVHQGSYDWGYSAGWDSRGDARERAMFHCRDHAGAGANCEVLTLTSRCAGLARGLQNGQPRFFAAEARGRDAAANAALAECTSALGASCEIRHNFCANDL